MNYNRTTHVNFAVSHYVFECISCKRLTPETSASFGLFLMCLRLLWLALCTLLVSSLVEAATLPLTSKTLSSQLRIDHQEMVISKEDWYWLRHKTELRVGVLSDESAPFSVNIEGSQYEGISADATALVAQRLGIQVKVVPFANALAAEQNLQAGSIDVIANYSRDKSNQDLIFSSPYSRDRLAVFKRSTELRDSPPRLGRLARGNHGQAHA